MTINTSSDPEYLRRLAEFELRLNAFEFHLEMKQNIASANTQSLKECVIKGDEKAFSAMIAAFHENLSLVIPHLIIYTDLTDHAWILEHNRSLTDLFVDSWLNIHEDSAELIIELAERNCDIPEKLLTKFDVDSIYITAKALSKVANKVDLPILKKWMERFSPASKALVFDQMEVQLSELVPKDEVVEVVEALEKMNSDKTVRFIASLPLNSFKELVNLRTPICIILNRCAFIPDLLRLKRMGTSKEHYLLHSLPYNARRVPFVNLIWQAINDGKTGLGGYIRNFPPILLILCLNHNVDIEQLYPYLSRNHRDVYSQISFIAAFGAHAHVLNVYDSLKQLGDPTLVYSLLKSLDVHRKEDDDCLALEDLASSINKKVQKYLDLLTSYHTQFKTRAIKALWSPEEIDNLEHFQELLKKTSSINFDARIAPFSQGRARLLLTADYAAVKRLCDEGNKLFPALMQYEDKNAKGVISKGPRGRSQDRVPIIWKTAL